MKTKIAKDLLSIKAVFFRPEEPFIWASGIKSPVYCDNRLTLSDVKVRTDMEEGLAALIREYHPEAEILMGTSTLSVSAESLAKASAYADSAYFCNINGHYERTLFFADSCRYYLNQHYRSQRPDGRQLMLSLGNPSLLAPEIAWYHDSLKTNYHIILDIRNESAVAALALHEWQLYSYNNRIYTQLLKEM